MTLNDLAKAHVRTIVPAVVGLIITLALRAGIDLHGYAPFITTAVTAAYYSAARLAEARLDPRFGWLLGVAAAPRYTHPAKTAAKDLSYTIKGRRHAPKDRGESFVWFLLAALAVCAGFLLAHVIIQAV